MSPNARLPAEFLGDCRMYAPAGVKTSPEMPVPDTMKAWVLGDPHELKLTDKPVPVPKRSRLWCAPGSRRRDFRPEACWRSCRGAFRSAEAIVASPKCRVPCLMLQRAAAHVAHILTVLTIADSFFNDLSLRRAPRRSPAPFRFLSKAPNPARRGGAS